MDFTSPVAIFDPATGGFTSTDPMATTTQAPGGPDVPGSAQDILKKKLLADRAQALAASQAQSQAPAPEASSYDPMSGALISGPATNAPGPGVGDAVSGLGSGLRTMFPPASPAPVKPAIAAPPEAPPQELPGAGPEAPAADGGQDMPVPPIPPQAAPQATAQAGPMDQVPASSEAPSDGISGNRRNNPLNLRFAGQNGAVNDGGFASFQTQDAGIAAAKNQFAINAKRGINTLSGLVSSWAPPNENDTAAYIRTVSAATGIDPNAKIDITDPAVQAKIIPAMSLMENGPIGKGRGGVQMAGGTPPAETMTLANSSTPVLQDTPSTPLPQTIPGFGANGLLDPNTMDLSRFQSSKGDKMLALASGLLGAPTFGAGLGKGLSNLNAMTTGDRTEGLKTYSAMAQAQIADAKARQMAQQFGLKTQAQSTGRFGKMPDGTPAEEFKNPTTGTTEWRPTGGATPTAVERVDNSKTATDARISGDPAANAAAQKDNAKAVDTIDAKGTAAVGQVRSLQNFQQAISNGATPGSDMVSQYKRELATRLGINLGDTDGSSVQLAQALGKQLQVQGVQGMRGLGLRTQNEFNTFVKQVAGLDQNPDVIKTLVAPLLDGANHDLEVYHKWHSMKPDEQLNVLKQRGGVSNWMAPQQEDYAASQGVTPGQPNQPTIAKTDNGWTSTTGGVKFKVNN